MDLTEDLFNEIDAYLNGRMSKTERQAFQQRMDANAELRQEVDTQEHIHQGLDAVAMQRQLATLRTGLVRRRQTRRTLQYAGALLLAGLLLTGGFYVTQSLLRPVTEQAFLEYYNPEPDTANSRADDDTMATLPPGLPEARADYYAGRYPYALNRLNALPADSLRLVPYYRGLTYLALEQPQNAITALQLATTSANLLTKQKSSWYLALAYLQANDAPRARQLLEPISKTDGHPYQDFAVELLGKLK